MFLHCCSLKGSVVMQVLILCHVWSISVHLTVYNTVKKNGQYQYKLIRRKKIPPGIWMFVCCECFVLSGRGICDELITRPEESYRLWCVVVYDLENLMNEEPNPINVIELNPTLVPWGLCDPSSL